MGDTVFLFLVSAGVLSAAVVLLWSLVVSLNWLFRPRPGEGRRSRGVMKCCLVCLLLGALLVILSLPATCRVPEAARRAACAKHLNYIAKAMNNYAAKHGHFPPAYSVDKDGRPLHSWRVLLLPYLNEEELYKQIRLDEPWDSPHNKAVFDATGVPPIFVCPTESNERRKDNVKETSYVMIVGPGTLSGGANSARLEDMSDGASHPIAVVEMSDSGIHWAEPRDLKADEMSYRVNDPDQPCIRSRHRGTANVAFCDGSVRTLIDSVPPELVKALTTIAGGEDVRSFWEDY